MLLQAEAFAVFSTLCLSLSPPPTLFHLSFHFFLSRLSEAHIIRHSPDFSVERTLSV